MFRIKLTQGSDRSKFRLWSPTAMTNAYKMVMERGASVYKAAKLHGLPETTLRDRIANRVSIDCTKSGPAPVLSLEEESRLCTHLKELAAVGYGYTRAEVVNLASDYAVSLGKRSSDEPFTIRWFYNFMKRWPELKVIRPSGLSEQRARCASKVAVSNYFTELERIIIKYNLKDKPQNIYNVDEKGINTEYKPPQVISEKTCRAQVVMPDRGKTVTIIGAGNAAGHQIPPFFVFPGMRMVDGLLEGKSPGTDGVVTKSGWSNGEVFKHYLKTHFTKFCMGRSEDDTILILYDGHRSHVSVDLVDWAKEHNIVLFVLPPHTSHLLQPMDIGCFGPLQIKYAQECSKFSRLNHRMVTRFDVCSLACKAYTIALSPNNLQAAFERTGIYPFQDSSIMVEKLNRNIQPSTLYRTDNAVTAEKDQCPAIPDNNSQCNKECADFFSERRGLVVEKVVKKKRRNISSVIGGKALEGDTAKKMKLYIADQPKCSKKSENKSTNKSQKKFVTPFKQDAKKQNVQNVQNAKPFNSPNPGTSGVSVINVDSDDTSVLSDFETESQISDSEKCCKCRRFYVQRHDNEILDIVNWVKCDNEECSHWVHLKYCTSLRVARKYTKFQCECCQ